MKVRAARAEDAAQLARVHVRSWQQGYRGLLPDALLDSLDVAQRTTRWRESLSRSDLPSRGTLVADDGTGVVGFAHLTSERGDGDATDHRGPAGEVQAFYVDPDRWGHGVGRALLTAAERTMAQAGYRSAVLWVLDTNTAGRAFYARLGWAADGTEKPDELGGARVREVRYRRTLTD